MYLSFHSEGSISCRYCLIEVLSTRSFNSSSSKLSSIKFFMNVLEVSQVGIFHQFRNGNKFAVNIQMGDLIVPMIGYVRHILHPFTNKLPILIFPLPEIYHISQESIFVDCDDFAILSSTTSSNLAPVTNFQLIANPFTSLFEKLLPLSILFTSFSGLFCFK